MRGAKEDIQKILDMNAEIVRMNASLLEKILNPPRFFVPEKMTPEEKRTMGDMYREM